MSRQTVAERVALGAALLDKHYGPSWVYRIDTERLRIVTPWDCVLGQVSLNGSYVTTAKLLGLSPDDDSQERHGVIGYTMNQAGDDPEHGPTDYVTDCSRLDDEWAHYITTRREAAQTGATTC